jgi:hypothetical protein
MMREREGGSEGRKHVILKLVFHQFILIITDHRNPSQQLSVSTGACLEHAFGGVPEPPTGQAFWSRSFS